MIVGAGDRARASSTRRWRCGGALAMPLDRRGGVAVRAPRDADLAPGAGAEGRPHRGRPTRRSSASRWCRRSAARTTCASASAGAPSAVRDGSLRQAGVEARFLPGLFFLPPLAIAVGALPRRPRGDRRRPHLGEFALFIHAAAPARLAARGAGLDHQPRPARARLGRPRSFAWLEGVRCCRSPSGRSRCPTAAGSASAARRALRATPAARRCSPASTSTSQPGEIVAVCGPTGAGKTTLLEPVPRFYDPTAGAVLLGGVDVRDLSLADSAPRWPSSPSARSCSPSRCART